MFSISYVLINTIALDQTETGLNSCNIFISVYRQRIAAYVEVASNVLPWCYTTWSTLNQVNPLQTAEMQPL